MGNVRHVFVSHNAAGFIWTSNLYLPLRPDYTGETITEKRTLKACIVPLSKGTRKLSPVCDLTAVVSLANYLNNPNKDCDWLILAYRYVV